MRQLKFFISYILRLVYLLTCWSFFFSIGVFATEKQPTILVQVKSKESLSSKDLKDFIGKNNLSADQYYPVLKIQSFRARGKSQSDLESICSSLKQKFSEILSCEVNQTLTPQLDSSSNCGNSSVIIDPNFEAMLQGILKFNGSEECDLFNKKNKDYQISGFDPNLSPFWAQEYIGADLLSEEMAEKAIDTSSIPRLLAIWDSDDEAHGENVANLIAGPYASSPIKFPKSIEHVNLAATEGYLASYEKTFARCKNNGICPRFINNSMGWNNSIMTKHVVGKLATEEEVIFVTAAGNQNGLVEDAKRESARNAESIIVASHAPNGLSSDFTSFAPEVDISAPSDYQILSYTHKGELQKFGGTSGATPLVTSSLLSFELISGLKLSVPQFKELLKKTAIRHQKDSPRKVTGAGYLNSYKIGAIAFKLHKLCKKHHAKKDKRDKCMIDHLKRDDLYDFSDEINENQMMVDLQAAFPHCTKSSAPADRIATCDKKKDVLKKLRKAAFLTPENTQLWDKLACVHSFEGLTSNANYYSRLARGKRISQEELLSNSIGNAEKVELLLSSEMTEENRKSVVSWVGQNVWSLQYASEALRNDREIVLTAVKSYGRTLEYASETLRNDREIVLTAVRNGGTLQYASKALRNDREFVLAAVQENGGALEHASKALRIDRVLLLTAVKRYGRTLEYASEALRNDREIVLTAVKGFPSPLQHASEALRNDREIVLTAIKRDVSSLEHASETLRNDREIVLAAVRQYGSSLEHASEALRNDREIVLAAVRKDRESSMMYESLQYASEALRNDREFVLTAIRWNGSSLQFASETLRNDREIVLAAIERNPDAWGFVSDNLKNDPEIKAKAGR